MNYELNELTGNAEIVRFIQSRRITLLGRVLRMDDKRTPKRILQWKPIGTKLEGDHGRDGLQALKKICI
jgi:hypothetical protein